MDYSIYFPKSLLDIFETVEIFTKYKVSSALPKEYRNFPCHPSSLFLAKHVDKNPILQAFHVEMGVRRPPTIDLKSLEKLGNTHFFDRFPREIYHSLSCYFQDYIDNGLYEQKLKSLIHFDDAFTFDIEDISTLSIFELKKVISDYKTSEKVDDFLFSLLENYLQYRQDKEQFLPIVQEIYRCLIEDPIDDQILSDIRSYVACYQLYGPEGALREDSSLQGVILYYAKELKIDVSTLDNHRAASGYGGYVFRVNMGNPEGYKMWVALCKEILDKQNLIHSVRGYIPEIKEYIDLKHREALFYPYVLTVLQKLKAAEITLYPELATIVAKEEEGFIGYHATTPRAYVFNEVIRSVVNNILGIKVPSDFFFFRAPGNPLFDDITVNTFKGVKIDDNYHPQRDQLVSLNPTLFSNFSSSGECTLTAFFRASSMGVQDSTLYIEQLGQFFSEVGIDPKKAEMIYQKALSMIKWQGIIVSVSEKFKKRKDFFWHTKQYVYLSYPHGVFAPGNLEEKLLSKTFEEKDQLRLVMNNQTTLCPTGPFSMHVYHKIDSLALHVHRFILKQELIKAIISPKKIAIARSLFCAMWDLPAVPIPSSL